MDKDQIIKLMMENDSYKENIEDILDLYFRENPNSLEEWDKWFTEGLEARKENYEALIVEYSVRTRVVVDSFLDEGGKEMQAMRMARANILKDPESYLIGENIVEIVPDESLPFDPMEDIPAY